MDYFVQQLINGLSLGSIYGLIDVRGRVGRILDATAFFTTNSTNQHE